jgi:hypothetical protein
MRVTIPRLLSASCELLTDSCATRVEKSRFGSARAAAGRRAVAGLAIGPSRAAAVVGADGTSAYR